MTNIELVDNLKELKVSKKPRERLIYLNGIKQLIFCGEELLKIQNDAGLFKNIEALKGLIKEYSVYCL